MVIEKTMGEICDWHDWNPDCCNVFRNSSLVGSLDGSEIVPFSIIRLNWFA